MNAIICKRDLRSTDNEHIISVFLYAPQQNESEEWSCTFKIKGPSHSIEKNAYGIDSFQAVMNAFEGIRAFLDQIGSLKWIGADDCGDHGFRRTVPCFLGTRFAMEIEKYIDNAVLEKTMSLKQNTATKKVSLDEKSKK